MDSIDPTVASQDGLGESAAKTGRSATGRGTRVGAVDRVFRDIVNGLYEGRFVPGQRLVEADIAAAYGVGRSTVREAITRLAAEFIVEVSPYRGAQIRRLRRKEAEDILILLELLIGLAARLAADRIDQPGMREELSDAIDAVMRFEELGDSVAFHSARNDFFRALVAASGNGELRRLLRSLNIHLLRVQMRPFGVEGSPERFEDYKAIAETILDGDGGKAEKAGRRYISRVASAVGALPDKVFAK